MRGKEKNLTAMLLIELAMYILADCDNFIIFFYVICMMFCLSIILDLIAIDISCYLSLSSYKSYKHGNVSRAYTGT